LIGTAVLAAAPTGATEKDRINIGIASHHNR